MRPRAHLYDALASLVRYPSDGYLVRLSTCAAELGREHADAAAALERFRAAVRSKTPEELEELYTRTFDINPACTLEVGWHIYGEDYARGELLVGFRRRMRELQLPESSELPDHLTHVLQVLGRLEGEEADQVAGSYLLPALQKMLAGLEEDTHPFRCVLEAVERVVREEHPVRIVEPRQRRAEPPGWNERVPMVQLGGRERTSRVADHGLLGRER